MAARGTAREVVTCAEPARRDTLTCSTPATDSSALPTRRSHEPHVIPATGTDTVVVRVAASMLTAAASSPIWRDALLVR